MEHVLSPLFKAEVTRVYKDMMNGDCPITPEQQDAFCEILMHKPMSKAAICEDLLNVSQSTFNMWLGMGWMPKGRHVKGFKELVWYKDEVLEAANKIKQ